MCHIVRLRLSLLNWETAYSHIVSVVFSLSRSLCFGSAHPIFFCVFQWHSLTCTTAWSGVQTSIPSSTRTHTHEREHSPAPVYLCVLSVNKIILLVSFEFYSGILCIPFDLKFNFNWMRHTVAFLSISSASNIKTVCVCVSLSLSLPLLLSPASLLHSWPLSSLWCRLHIPSLNSFEWKLAIEGAVEV